ncbi:MAG: proton-conducting transporter membrane subunit, partial [Chloroflexia bacterium]
MSQAAFWATVVLLGGGLGLLLAGRVTRASPGRDRVLAWTALGLGLAAGLPFLLWRSGPPEFALGQWTLAGNWRISLSWRFDLLSQALALPAGISALLFLLWLAVGSSGEERRQAPWVLLLLALFLTLLGSADLLLAYAVWEVWVLAAYGLLVSPRPRLAVPGVAEWYLGTQHAAGYFFLAALLLVGQAGTLEHGRLGIGAVGAAALLLVAGAAWIRTAQVPFQNWATAAAGAAGATGLMLIGNGGLLAGPYLWLRLLPKAVEAWPGEVLLIGGSVSLVGNAALALRQRGAGPIQAVDSAARLALIWMALGLGGPWGIGAGWILALDLLLSKAVFYPALTGLGLGKEARQGLFALGVWQAAGLPPSLGFVGRWLLVLGMIEAGRWVYLPVVLLATPLLLACHWRARTLLPRMEEPASRPAAVRWGALVVAALVTVAGATVPWLWQPLLEPAA